MPRSCIKQLAKTRSMTAGLGEWMLRTARERRATHRVEAVMVSAMTAGPGSAATRDATLAQSRDYMLDPPYCTKRPQSLLGCCYYQVNLTTE